MITPSTPDTGPPPMRPFILVNMAMTADGKIATSDRRTTSFGSSLDHDRLYALREGADAVLCGAGTANEPGVTLGLRKSARPRPWLRVVASGSARLRPDADVFREPSSPLLVLVHAGAPSRRRTRLAAAGAEVCTFGGRELDLAAALHWLRASRGVRRLVCEGGAELNDTLFRGGWVDEVHVTLCPRLVGGRTAPTLVEGKGIPGLADAVRFRWARVERQGDELFLVLRPARRRSGRRT